MRRVFVVGVVVFTCITSPAQELYPNSEPASTMPRGVAGLRLFTDYYSELGTPKNMIGLRLMYGVSKKLSCYVTATASNHHGHNFPDNLITHEHTATKTIYGTGNFTRGLVYPLQLNGLHIYSKFRFFSSDKQNEHFRVAAYAEASKMQVAHDEAEPNLIDDNSGIGMGLISTYLYHKFALTLTGGAIKSGSHTGLSRDLYTNEMISTTIYYGDALVYRLAMGYLVYPRQYKNYKQPNINLYLEINGKSYSAARVTQYGGVVEVPIQTALLKSGNYAEIHPALQVILRSNLRIDASVGFPLIGKSYVRYYPFYALGIQRYFYPKRRT